MLAVINVTCRNRQEAAVIARALLKKKLVACVNIWPVDSIYWWKAKMVAGREAVLACKTTTRHVAAATRLIERLHSYEVPVITVEKITANIKALRWANEVTNH